MMKTKKTRIIGIIICVLICLAAVTVMYGELALKHSADVTDDTEAKFDPMLYIVALMIAAVTAKYAIHLWPDGTA